MLDPQQLVTGPMWTCLQVRCRQEKGNSYSTEFMGLSNESTKQLKKLERMEQQKKKDVEDELLARPCTVYEWQLVQPMQQPLNHLLYGFFSDTSSSHVEC